MIIYTIGYAGRKLSRFIEFLRDLGINVVIDVRRFPRSKYEGFNREELEEILPEHGLEYVYLGDLLGGFRRSGYEKFMESSEFKKGIEKVMKIAKRKKVVLMCRERSYKWCHRKYIAEALEFKGYKIIHL